MYMYIYIKYLLETGDGNVQSCVMTRLQWTMTVLILAVIEMLHI